MHNCTCDSQHKRRRVKRRALVLAMLRAVAAFAPRPPCRAAARIGERAPRIRATSTRGVIERTRRWLDAFVVGMDLCPFARASLPTLVIETCDAASSFDAFDVIIARETCRLTACAKDAPATTLVVLEDDARWLGADGWMAFMDGPVARAEETCERLSGEEVMVVPFHPHATWSDDDDDDDDMAEEPGDYTSRSPSPTVHLLRKCDVDNAETTWYRAQGREDIRERNVEYLRAMGLASLRDAMRRVVE